MSEMKLFRVSNQRWKLVLGVVFLVVEALLLASMIMGYATSGAGLFSGFGLEPSHFGLLFMGFGLLVCFPWIAFSLRCPRCRKAMVWYVMRHRDQREFVPLFVNLLHVGCPACNRDYNSGS